MVKIKNVTVREGSASQYFVKSGIGLSRASACQSKPWWPVMCMCSTVLTCVHRSRVIRGSRLLIAHLSASQALVDRCHDQLLHKQEIGVPCLFKRGRVISFDSPQSTSKWVFREPHVQLQLALRAHGLQTILPSLFLAPSPEAGNYSAPEALLRPVKKLNGCVETVATAASSSFGTTPWYMRQTRHVFPVAGIARDPSWMQAERQTW